MFSDEGADKILVNLNYRTLRMKSKNARGGEILIKYK